MIDSLEISNFKCIRHVELPLAGITMLAGLNGMGKSTCIQSLLLLHQSFQEHSPGLGQLVRNGSWIGLGTPRDILFEAAGEDRISFKLGFPSPISSVAFPYSLDTGLDEFVFDGDPPSELPGGHGIFTGDLHYIRAERNGPQTSSPTSNAEVRVHRRLGRDGEYAAQYLSEFGEEEIQNRALLHPGALSAQLRHQVEAWLGEISPGTRIYAQSHSALDRVSLHYAFATGRGETNHYRATNVGFGLSYLLPVLIVALAAPPGALLLLENPEAHIHPRGQMSIGRLLALASLGSVQIIVETHSDHILNGLRLAVHGGQVTPEDVALHYFQRQVEAHSNHSIVTSPGIDRDGRLDQWPDGFFDQNEKAMRELLMPGRKK